MKIDFIEVEGFRGFRNRFHLEIPPGFAVISGRNGVGKSTLFDAVEYLLTGTISKYGVDKAASETVSDYIWWRGEGHAKSYHVELGLIDEDGQRIALRRSRDKNMLSVTAEGLRERLTVATEAPGDALEQICATSIIRDELITKTSLEQTETNRFSFVSAAVGSSRAARDVERADQLLRETKKNENEAKREYERSRDIVNDLSEQLTRIRDAALNIGDVAAATSFLESELGMPASREHFIGLVRGQLAERQGTLARLRTISELLSSWRSEMEWIGSEAYRSELQAATQRVNDCKHQIELIQAQLNSIESELQRERDANQMAATLSSLLTLGSTVGLVDGHCPLCDTALSLSQFKSGMVSAQRRLSTGTKRIAELEAQLLETKSRMRAAREALVFAESDQQRLTQADAEAASRRNALVEALTGIGLGEVVLAEPARLQIEIDALAAKVAALERAMQTVLSARSASFLPDAEARLTAAREESDKAEARFEKAARATQIAADIRRAILRTGNEISEERLAAISPLLTELYQRLRPHIDWRKLEYRLRGDVRKFLSLSVGEELNPQFMFSSGQRRAAGLAFLIAVYLSTAWNKLKTLMLDDPVQHIDDYRSLNIVEVLAALRRSDQQIICAVEDDALAGLLGRRLRSTYVSPGAVYALDVDAEGHPFVSRFRKIEPFVATLEKEPPRQVG